MTVLDIFLGMRAVIIILELLLVARTWMVRGFCEVDECTLFLPVTSSQSSCKRARCTLAFEILQTPVVPITHIARATLELAVWECLGAWRPELRPVDSDGPVHVNACLL